MQCGKMYVSWTGVLLLLVFLISFLDLTTIHARSSKRKPSKPKTRKPGVDVKHYLKEYGYLIDGNTDRSDIEDSIREFQKHSGLKETGVPDESTLGNMREFRCGNADMTEGPNQEPVDIPPVPWEKKELTYRIENTSMSLRNIDIIRKDIGRAFEFWAKEADIIITEMLDNNIAVDIEISFEVGPHKDNHTFVKRDRVVAHAFNSAAEDYVKGDIHFNDYIKWSSGPGKRDTFDFLKVATHEVGHALGLQHSNETRASMYYIVTADHDESFMLHSVDKESIKNLYGARQSDVVDSYDNNDLETSASDTVLNYNPNQLQPRISTNWGNNRMNNQNFQYNQNPDWVTVVCSQQLQLWPFQCYGYWGQYCCSRYLEQFYFYQQQQQQQYFAGWNQQNNLRRQNPI